MKKFRLYGAVSLSFLLLSILLSNLLDFSLTNTWQGLVALLLIFGPLWICSWKGISVYKGNLSVLCFLGKFCLVLLVGGYLLTIIAFLAGLL